MSWICDSCMHSPPAENKPCAACNPEDPVTSCYQAARGWGGDKYQNTAIRCPFLKRWIHKGTRRFILCEGPYKKTSVMVKFYNGKEMDEHMETLCRRDFEKCRLYQATIIKHETGRG